MDTYGTRFDPYLPGQGGPGGVSAQSLDAAIAENFLSQNPSWESGIALRVR